MQFHVSLEQLKVFAEQFWKSVGDAKVFAFHGEMGAGKTTIISALCHYKGIKDVAGSPTFSIINEYAFSENGEAKKIFQADYRLYSGAVVDVVFDHFLATDETEFSEHRLFEFSMEVYAVLEQQQEWFPERFGHMFPHMKNHNWLFNYRTRWGAGRSLTGLVHRSKYLSEADTAFRLFEEHYQQLGDCYRYFWSFAKPFARHRFDEFMGDQATGIV